MAAVDGCLRGEVIHGWRGGRRWGANVPVLITVSRKYLTITIILILDENRLICLTRMFNWASTKFKFILFVKAFDETTLRTFQI